MIFVTFLSCPEIAKQTPIALGSVSQFSTAPSTNKLAVSHASSPKTAVSPLTFPHSYPK